MRFVVGQVLSTGRSLTKEDEIAAYALFRQEKSFDKRELPFEKMLQAELSADEAEKPLVITKVSEVVGVNALCEGSSIEPHEGLTILFGENGTGKTGYSRVFKALADSRTADEIIGNISLDVAVPQSAKIAYKLDGQATEHIWNGMRGQKPFTRLSIFDSPSVNFHVDDELEYTYVPTVLALFNHVVAGIKAVQIQIDEAIVQLSAGTTILLERFPKDSSVYPLVETLGASTDLQSLKDRSDHDPTLSERISVLGRAIAALEANTTAAQITSCQRAVRVLSEAASAAGALSAFDDTTYNNSLARKSDLRKDYETFREELFKSADLPAAPDASWQAFVSSGEEYRAHLDGLGAHDVERCLYCRQVLGESARGLVTKYGDYLADKINAEIEATNAQIGIATELLRSTRIGEVSAFVSEFEGRDDQPDYYAVATRLQKRFLATYEALGGENTVPENFKTEVSHLLAELENSLASCTSDLVALQLQARDRVGALTEKKRELSELMAAAELSKSWPEIERRVRNAKEADRLKILVRTMPNLSRNVTDLAKTASDELINQSFDKLFFEECLALRAPMLQVEFLGRQGKAQRRKVISGKHKPSKILSEGEQKVLAIADFLAEARLAGITAPVIFDDPVSSLDHRRVNEVAKRVALLAESNQVIVFTHDIFFATTLLSLFEKSKRCAYFQITDDGGVGKVTRATGPRWDTLSNVKGHINSTIQAARAMDGEARAALIRTGYDWIRSWCEIFTETELLQGVTQRYQPHVRMTVLPSIKAGALPAAVTIVTRVFEDACRFIDGHSQPLPTLGVSPTLEGLESHWGELQECKKRYFEAVD